MQRGVLILILAAALAGGLFGALLTRLLEPAPAVARTSARDPSAAQALQEIAELRREVASMRRSPEVEVARPERPPVAAPAPPEPRPKAPAEPAPEEEVAPADLLEGILGKPFNWQQSNRLFYRLTSNVAKIDRTIDRLKKEIERDPANADLRVALATTWVAKTASMTPGPAQGESWGEATKAYDAAIELDPNHWQARYGKAFGQSMAPEFVGLRPGAIKQFEELVEIQRRLPLAPEHSQSYYRLGTLYKDAGNPEKARQVWLDGQKLFPDDQQLKEALEVLSQR